VICLARTTASARLFDRLLKRYDDTSTECRVVHTSGDLSFGISYAMLQLEKEFTTSHQFWTDKPRYAAIVVLWEPVTEIGIGHIVAKLNDLRGDEIMFSTMNSYQPIAWVAGHPRAVVKWASGLPWIATTEMETWPKIHGKSDTSVYSWWAQRINLRVLE